MDLVKWRKIASEAYRRWYLVVPGYLVGSHVSLVFWIFFGNWPFSEEVPEPFSLLAMAESNYSTLIDGLCSAYLAGLLAPSKRFTVTAFAAGAGCFLIFMEGLSWYLSIARVAVLEPQSELVDSILSDYSWGFLAQLMGGGLAMLALVITSRISGKGKVLVGY